MKRMAVLALVAVMMVLGNGVVRAQGKYGADSAECIKYLSYYTEYYKQKNYDEALPHWRKAYKICPPQARQGIFVDGTTLIRRQINKAVANKAYRAALIDTLMTLHDTRAEYYPKYAVTALNNKGTDINNYYNGDSRKIYDGLESIIGKLGTKTKGSLLLFDLNAAISLFQNDEIDAENVISIYQRNIALLEQDVPANDAERETNAKIKSDMEGLFIGSKVASCENLIALFTPRYEANPDDLELVTNIVKMMSSTEDCIDNDLYLKAVTSMHKLNPSAQSAYFLYRLNAARDNKEEAVRYMEEALASTDLDQATLAGYNYEFATFCVKNSMPSKGFAAAQKALELDSSYTGKSFFLMGTFWGSVTCGGDEIARRSPYWVACDYMQRAKNADPSLAEECNRMIGQYSIYFPKTEDAFMYDLTNGQSYTVSCGGMRAVTTVRTQK